MSDSTHTLHHVPLNLSHNQRLRELTHPENWRAPTPAPTYDLVVIGGGTGGLVSAGIVAKLGGKVALVERAYLGGDCLVRGCMPSKALIEIAGRWHEASAGERWGLPASRGDRDFGRVMDHVRAARAEVAPHDSAERFAQMGVDVFLGHARFEDTHRVVVDDRHTLSFRRAIIATGSRPAIPDIEGLDTVRYYTNETFFEIDALPKRLGIIGGGPIGCEMAQAFARFGSLVHVFEHGEQLLGREDADVAGTLSECLRSEGVVLYLGAKVRRVSQRDDGAIAIATHRDDGERETIVDALLVATGRRPNVEQLGLESAGVRCSSEEGLAVDRHLATSQAHIYAVGDVALKYRFTHLADASARVAVRNAFAPLGEPVQELVVPWCTYTDPEIARVGLGRDQARERAVDVDCYQIDFSDNDRAVASGHTVGFARVLTKKGSDEILGAVIVGRGAGEIIPYLSNAKARGEGLGSLSSCIFPYPTRAEIVRQLADQYTQSRLSSTLHKLSSGYFATGRKIFEKLGGPSDDKPSAGE